MPNWCSTNYRIVGEKESLGKVKKMITELDSMKEPRVENGFGKLWLGCIVDYLGGDWQSISCRGNIESYEFDDNEIRLCLEVAWAESPDFRHFLEDKIPGIKIYQYSEEFGCSGCWTNDPDYSWQYYLDSCLSEIESEYFESLEDAAHYLQENGIECKLTDDYKTLSEAISKYSEEHEDEYLNLYEIEFVDN